MPIIYDIETISTGEFDPDTHQILMLDVSDATMSAGGSNRFAPLFHLLVRKNLKRQLILLILLSTLKSIQIILQVDFYRFLGEMDLFSPLLHQMQL